MWSRIDELSPRSLTDGDWIETKNQSPDGGIRLIQLADIGVGFIPRQNHRASLLRKTEVRLKCTRLAVGDVLIARLPRPIGRACVFSRHWPARNHCSGCSDSCGPMRNNLGRISNCRTERTHDTSANRSIWKGRDTLSRVKRGHLRSVSVAPTAPRRTTPHRRQS